MEIRYIDTKEKFKLDDEIVACIGYFDGLHKGHQALVDKVKEKALEYNCKKALITFYPDPKDVITGKVHKHIQSFDSRLKIIENLDIDLCIIFKFDIDMCKMSKQDFLNNLLKLNLKCLICGFDYHYAYKGEGNYQSLKEDAKDYFEVLKIDEVIYQNEKISSTRIRDNIVDGNITLVNELLGYTYFIKGIVCHGKKIGRKIGFPTINLKVNEETLFLKEGVYIGYMKYQNDYYKAMINIGKNPTIACDNNCTIEAYIIDFNENIYDKEVIFYFNKKIRDVIKFNSYEELSTQLSKDAETARLQNDETRFIL